MGDRAGAFWLGVTKLSLNLAIIGALLFLVLFGYALFATGSNSQSEAIRDSCILIASVVGVVLLTKLSKKGALDDTQPSFKLTTLSVIGLALILGFAGVEPVAHYLRQLGNTIDPWISWAALGWQLSLLFAMINPLYGLVFVAVIVWIIYLIRHS